MALIGINQPRARPAKKDTLDRIVQGVDLATKIVGTGMAIPEFLQNRALGKAKIEKTEAETKAIPRRLELLKDKNKPMSLSESVALAKAAKVDPVLFEGKSANHPFVTTAVRASQGGQRIDVSEQSLGERTREFDENIALRRQKRVDDARRDIQRDFSKDKIIDKANQQIASANNLLTMANLTEQNPIVAQAVRVFAARASGEVGNLAQAEQENFGGSKAILDRLSQIMQTAGTGTMTAENAQFLRSFAETMKVASQKNLTRRGNVLVRRLARRTEFFNEDQVRGILGLEVADTDPEVDDLLEDI